MRGMIEKALRESEDLKKEFFEKNIDKVLEIGELMAESLKNEKKILIFGNGGSAADAQHFAGEMINKFQIVRAPLPAIALTTDTSVITSIANDSSFNEIFEKQVEALGNEGDWAIAISTSGKSENVLRAINKAKEKGLKILFLTGEAGENFKNVDYLLAVPSKNTPRIQEVHIFILHLICEIIEYRLF
ncbi:MAG: D-sedoheptulose-7-phosphate isomerase [Candidatus Aminicenantia bacterium]